ncbi:MAG: hypothetical protein APR55_06180 [Methanolinea sp. SDB]|jgi:PKD repeat protein|nr:MAG: hypothetical protein APR55_06180 [Methanolinea sp. SDB]
MNTSYGSAPLTVNFTDMSFRDPATWSWDFGDGAGSILQNPNHTFMDPGTYQVTLTVSNMKGQNSAFKNVFVW